MDLPYYLYYTPVPIGDKKVYARTMVKGILINYDYSKTDTEDDTEPYRFLTSLLRYRLKDNPLSPTLLAYLSVWTADKPHSPMAHTKRKQESNAHHKEIAVITEDGRPDRQSDDCGQNHSQA